MGGQNNNVNGEKDITNKELLREIHKDIQMHSERLGKIEDAIITLAATQERVRVLDESLQKHVTLNQQFQNDVWAEFKETHTEHTKCLEARVLLFERTAEADKELDKLKTWKEEAHLKISANAKTRSVIEKVAVGAVVAVVSAIVITIWGIRAPGEKYASLEKSLTNHLAASSEIRDLIEGEHIEINELKEMLSSHSEEVQTHRDERDDH